MSEDEKAAGKSDVPANNTRKKRLSSCANTLSESEQKQLQKGLKSWIKGGIATSNDCENNQELMSAVNEVQEEFTVDNVNKNLQQGQVSEDCNSNPSSKRSSVGQIVLVMQEKIKAASPVLNYLGKTNKAHVPQAPSYKMNEMSATHVTVQSVVNEDTMSRVSDQLCLKSHALQFQHDQHKKFAHYLNSRRSEVVWGGVATDSEDEWQQVQHKPTSKHSNRRRATWLCGDLMYQEIDTKYEEDDVSECEAINSQENNAEDPESDLNNQQEEEEVIEAYKKRLKERDEMVVFDMFELILVKLSQMEERIGGIKRNQNEVSRKINKLTKLQNTQAKELEQVGEAATSLVKATIKCEQDLKVVKNKLQRVEVTQLKGNLVLSGIPETKGENVFDKVESFFKMQMQIGNTVEVQSAYRLGKQMDKPRPIFVCLYNAEDAGYVMSHAKNVADKTNDMGTNFVVKEQMTERGEKRVPAKNM